MKKIDIKSLIMGIIGLSIFVILMGSSTIRSSGKYSVQCSQSDCIILNTQNGSFRQAGMISEESKSLTMRQKRLFHLSGKPADF